MTCEEFARTLDEQSAPTPAAAEHARGCAACRRELERWSAVRAQLHAMRGEETPPFLHARVMAHVQAARAERSGRAARLSWLRPAIAGPLLLLALAAGLGGVHVWRRLTAPEGESAGAVVAERRQVEKGSDIGAAPRAAGAKEIVEPAAPPTQESAESRARRAPPAKIGGNEIAGRVAAPDQPPAAPKADSPRPAPASALPDESASAAIAVAAADAAASEEAAYADEARAERAKAAPAGPRLAAQASQRRAVVPCRVETEDGALAGIAELPAGECRAGPPDRLLVVAEQGTMVFLDLTSRTTESPSPAALAALRELPLPPGRYRLAPAAP